MSIDAIRKLRRKFILICMLSIACVVAVILIIINLMNDLTTKKQMYDLLEYICENDGEIPEDSHHDSEEEQTDEGEDDHLDSMNRNQDLSIVGVFLQGVSNIVTSPEFIYQTRYFAVLADADNTVTEVKTNHITSIDSDDAVAYAEIARNRLFTFGNLGVYYYNVQVKDDGSSCTVFLDCTTYVNMRMRLFYASLITFFNIMLIIFWPIWIFSRKLIEPEIKAVERQKQFITNASHELKTPLAVIRANTEVEEMINGEDEWTRSTLRQVDRMNDLIKNLVQIARADERLDKSAMTEINVSKAVRDAASTFESVAVSEGKTLELDIAEDIMMVSDEGAITQLTSLLVDNAIKYCDDGGKVTVQAFKKGKNLRLNVSNDYAEGANVDYSRFFERFYRSDESHNADKGGYGIGLSIAESIVHRFNGTISASWKEGVITFACVIS